MVSGAPCQPANDGFTLRCQTRVYVVDELFIAGDPLFLLTLGNSGDTIQGAKGAVKISEFEILVNVHGLANIRRAAAVNEPIPEQAKPLPFQIRESHSSQPPGRRSCDRPR